MRGRLGVPFALEAAQGALLFEANAFAGVRQKHQKIDLSRLLGFRLLARALGL